MLLADKIALVTGAGSGIGRATALRFAQEGARMVIADLNEEGLEATAQGITAAGGQVVKVTGNVALRDDAQGMVNAATAEFGRLDILINNAGITRDGLTTRFKDGEVKFLSEDNWNAVLDVNLKGSWLCAQLAAVPMIKQMSGRIVNTASIAVLGNIGQANYSASKAGIIGLTKTLALEWARYGIAVNAVAPGGVKTPMTATIPEKIMEGILQQIPYRRMAEPEEIAAVHLFLCSDMASYITGQVIFVDGGLSVGT
jgi:3-oxoacyl-[acyl-carrier protein] reductase